MHPWKNVRIFISSTFRDMQAERDWLVRFVFPRLREELLPHRIHFVDVDLRWGVTSEQDALGVCREVIDECWPRFIGILGGRYGWVPPGRTESITADEIRYGVLGREAEKRGQAFFYFRDPQATAGIAEETPGDFHDPDGSDAANKLAALKQAIADGGLPIFIYPAQWDAAQQRLTGLEAFGNQVHADLLQSLKDDPELADRFTGKSDAETDSFVRECADEAEQMNGFIEERSQPDRYVIGSREPLLREMLAFATVNPAAPGPAIFVLTGGPGSGKSALLAHFCRHSTLNSQPSTLLLPHFIGASTGSTDLRRTLRRLCYELARAAGNTEPLSLDIKELITHFQKLLAEAAGGRRVILVFDALNQFDATDGAHWLNWLPRELPPGVRIVASVIALADGQPEHQTLAILRTRPGTRLEKLEPLTEADTLAVIEGYLRRYAKRLSPEQLAALLAKPAGCLPLYVLTALEELRTLGTYEEITERIRTLPGDARALFGWVLTERLARDPGFRDREGRPCGAALVETFAACLGVSRHGLSPAELTALLDPGDPLGNVAALLRLLRPYLMRRGELLDFYHGQFREAAEAAHLDTPEKKRAAHGSVGVCLQAFADPHHDGHSLDATPHALSELPHHQTCGEAWPDLIATLENIFFLEAKVTHGMGFDLAEDFTAAVDALPVEDPERQRLRLLHEALRRDIHFVAHHAQDYPQALFQCLWNSCWWYDCPQAANHYLVQNDPNIVYAWERGNPKVCALMEKWRDVKERKSPGFIWVRTLRPPALRLDSGQAAVLRGHKHYVYCVAVSSDGRRIASGCNESIRLWDTKSSVEILVISLDGYPVRSLAFSPDGMRIASGLSWAGVCIWDANCGLQLNCLRPSEAKPGPKEIWSVVWSPNGHSIAGACQAKVHIWDAQTGVELSVLQGHLNWVWSIDWSPKGDRIVSGSQDGTVRIWDAQTGAELITIHGQSQSVRNVAWSPDGRFILSGSGGRLGDVAVEFATVRIWEARSGKEVFLATGCHGPLAWSPDSLGVVCRARDTLRVIDVTTGKTTTVLPHQQGVIDFCFCRDGKRIVTCASDANIRIWNVQPRERAPALIGHASGIMAVACSHSGSQVATGSADHTIRIWDLETGLQLALHAGHNGSVRYLSFSTDDHYLVSSCDNNSIRIWEAGSSQEPATLLGHESSVQCAAFSPDGRLLVSSSIDNTLRIWELATATERACISQAASAKVVCSVDDRAYKTSPVNRVTYSPDGRSIVGASDYAFDGVGWIEQRIWDAETGECIGNKQISEGASDKAAHSPFLSAGSTRQLIYAIGGEWSGCGLETRFVTADPSTHAWLVDHYTEFFTNAEGRTQVAVAGSYHQILVFEGVLPLRLGERGRDMNLDR